MNRKGKVSNMEQTFKKYTCSLCGAIKEIRTNHNGECLDYCSGCSWKAFYRGESNSFATPLHKHCRVFRIEGRE